jgi:hypothetical protein
LNALFIQVWLYLYTLVHKCNMVSLLLHQKWTILIKTERNERLIENMFCVLISRMTCVTCYDTPTKTISRSNKYQYKSIWFDSTKARTTIYCTRGEHADHYTTDVVKKQYKGHYIYDMEMATWTYIV